MNLPDPEMAWAFARHNLREVPAFGINHAKRVLNNADEISKAMPKGLPVDKDVLQTAAILHNVGAKQSLSYAQDIRQTSLSLAKKFLGRGGYTKEQTEKILVAIKEQPYGGSPETAEAKVLHDAILLEYSGALGFIKDIYVLGLTKTPLPLAIKKIRSNREVLGQGFQTKKGRELGEERVKAYRKLSLELENELASPK